MLFIRRIRFSFADFVVLVVEQRYLVVFRFVEELLVVVLLALQLVAVELV
jgi:hypothetical protein